MKAFVTGGAGFIGSNLVDALLARGDASTVLDDLSTGRRENLDGALAAGAMLHEVDIARRASACASCVAAARPSVVFHLAAQIDVRRSVADPAFDARVNVEGTINVLEAARRAGARRVVYSSTGGAIYGERRAIPTPEDAPARAAGALRRSASTPARATRAVRAPHGLSTVALRYANVYGPRQDPLGEGGVIAIFCGKLAEGAHADDLRRRRADARLRLRRRRRGGQPRRRRRRTGRRSATSAPASRRPCSSSPTRCAGSAAAPPFEPRYAPARDRRGPRSASTPALAREVARLAAAQVELADGLERTLATVRD